MKERLDVILVEQGYAPSREKAKAIIMSGNVYVNGQKEDKAGSMFEETANIEVRGATLKYVSRGGLKLQKEDKAGTGFDVSKIKLEVRDHTMKYVSRGGLKLEKAMEQWGFLLDGMICMDIGASTGGFTDCMLQNGATKVYSVDVGQGQLAWKLRNDERVVCMEQTNFRYVTPEDIPDALDFASVDVSFISLTKILIPARNLLKAGGQMVCLIKPQFEAGRGKVGKNGVVREPQIHEEVIRKIIDYADSIGFEVLHLEYSPIKGPEGNIEYLLHIRKPEEIPEEKLALNEHEAESALQIIVEEKTGLSYTPEWDALIKGIVDNSHTL